MKGLCVYVDGGKGHYVPAVTIKTAMEELGHEMYLEEFFDFLDIRWLGKINKFFWRQMLRHSKLENKVSRHNDQSNGMEFAVRFGIKHCMRCLRSYLDERPVDFIFCTHPYASTVLSEMLSKEEINIPVYYFATDVFSAPKASICNKLRKFFISTEEGANTVIGMGQDKDSVVVCPFPLQQNLAMSPRYTKKEARYKLGLSEELFTIQFNLGGEGLGSLDVIDAIAKTGIPMQVVVIGGIDNKMRKRFDLLKKRLPDNVSLVIAGFVKNVNEYMYAADVIVGRAGINTLLEAFYSRRPFLITELVYTVMASADYVVKYEVGWNCNRDRNAQLDVLDKCLSDSAYFSGLDKNFDSIPIEFSASGLAKLIEADVMEYKSGKGLA